MIETVANATMVMLCVVFVILAISVVAIFIGVLLGFIKIEKR